jgi:hypothetical protein
MSRTTERDAFVVACPDCEVERATDDPNETVAFYRRHSATTGHDVTVERAPEAGLDDVPDDADVRAVVAALEERYEEGVPIGVVAAAMSARGETIGGTLDAIHTQRMRGGLYEPRDDHLRVF